MPRLARLLFPPLCAIALLAGCGDEAPAPQPPEVTVVTVEPRDTAITLNFVAQTESSKQVDVRARVGGILEQRLYTEGGVVKQGQVLFRIDPKPYQAAVDAARGALGEAQAQADNARVYFQRAQRLVKTGVLSQQDFDTARANQEQSRAAVEAAKGQLEQQQLNLGYSEVTSPITGIAGRARQNNGTYITPGSNDLLCTVTNLDPIWVNFSVSENDLLRQREEERAGRLLFPSEDMLEVEVVLADGHIYPHRGRIKFREPTFNPQTGTFFVRAELPNPDAELNPGQFVRVNLHGIERLDAILVPQRAVTQGAKSHFVYVVNADNKIEFRAVGVGDWLGDQWFINQGLQAGDRVVVDGAAMLPPGTPVRIVEAGR